MLATTSWESMFETLVEYVEKKVRKLGRMVAHCAVVANSTVALTAISKNNPITIGRRRKKANGMETFQLIIVLMTILPEPLGGGLIGNVLLM